jgi:hypothetical protein
MENKSITIKIIYRNKESEIITFENDQQKIEYINKIPQKKIWKIEWIR